VSGGATGLTLGGLLFMLLAWGGIGAVTAFCFYRILVTRDRGR
jgi:hypothetical protein